jgi:hypothetical protein
MEVWIGAQRVRKGQVITYLINDRLISDIHDLIVGFLILFVRQIARYYGIATTS